MPGDISCGISGRGGMGQDEVSSKVFNSARRDTRCQPESEMDATIVRQWRSTTNCSFYRAETPFFLSTVRNGLTALTIEHH